MTKSALQKRKDNPKSTYWKNKADKLWGKVIHAKYDRCVIESPDCKGNLEAHHLISRSHVCTRHKIDNGVLLCSKHHKYDTLLSAHKAPLAFAEWMQTARPDQWEWFSANKWSLGKPDYKQAYDDLVAWCEAHDCEHLVKEAA